MSNEPSNKTHRQSKEARFASRGTQCQDDWYQKFLDGVAENYRRIVVPVGKLRRNGIEHRDIGHVFMISLDDFRCV